MEQRKEDKKNISVGYMIKFIWPTFGSLQAFSDGRLRTVVRRISFVFSFGPHICKCYRSKSKHSSSYVPMMFGKMVGNGGI